MECLKCGCQDFTSVTANIDNRQVPMVICQKCYQAVPNYMKIDGLKQIIRDFVKKHYSGNNALNLLEIILEYLQEDELLMFANYLQVSTNKREDFERWHNLILRNIS